jgi:metallo-beta-lactamase family protein
MNIHFLGAARTVTGSMHLLEINGRKLLLDCGLAQGSRKQTFERNRNLPFRPGDIDAIILSHAHIDHSGNLPSLVRSDFTGNIYTTPATRNLCTYMLRDSAHIQESDVAYVNKKRKRQGKNLFEPLYTQRDAMNILRHFVAVDYHHPFEPLPGVRATFLDAGHILGSAVTLLDITENGRRHRLAFSGDLGHSNQPILRAPEIPEGIDTLIMESTYGNRLHEPVEEGNQTFLDLVKATHAGRGKLLIPAFALGRTQHLVYRLDQLAESGKLPPIDVFVDSPLAVNLTEVFRLHPECFNRQALDAMAREPDHDLLRFARLRYVRSVEESKSLNEPQEPAIIISASGMCEGGRILHHLKNNIGKPGATVLFVGFQGRHTLGRRLLDGVSPVRIFGDEHTVKAQIRQVHAYSAHADRQGLLDWAGAVQSKGKLKRVFLVHGEEEAAFALADVLKEQKILSVDVPEAGHMEKL